MFVRPNKTKVATPNDVVMTNPETAKWIVDYFRPQFSEYDSFLEPAAGLNAFYNVLPGNKHRTEISDGLDFFDFNEKVNWVITNPPFSIYDDFLIHSFEISDNVVFFCPLNKAFKSKKIDKKIEEYGGLKEVIMMGTGGQHGFPFGFPVGCLHYQKNYTENNIKLTRFYN